MAAQAAILIRVPLVTDDVVSVMQLFGVTLDPRPVDQVLSYVGLLQNWSRVVNLTSIREPAEILRRHFGESLFITSIVQLGGRLVDVGTGAGFPGLALKIACPELEVTLLEPVARKRAFLKEVVRTCRLGGVEIRGERVEQLARTGVKPFDFVTARAVGSFETVLPALRCCLAPTGRVCLWLTGTEARSLARTNADFAGLFEWDPPVPVPLSHDREIWVGRPRSGKDVPRET